LRDREHDNEEHDNEESSMRHVYIHTNQRYTKNPTACAASARHDLLRWAGSLGAISAEALAVRLDVSVASARSRLADARRRGLLVRSRPLTQAPALYSLTPAGARACGSSGRICRVRPTNATHLLACASVAAALERCYPGFRAIGERELRNAERACAVGRPLTSAPLAALYAGSSARHRPDLMLVPKSAGPESAGPESAGIGWAGPGWAGIESTGFEPPVAIEVELTVKAPRRLRAICRAWERCRTVAGVIYLVAPSVEPALTRAVAATEARRIAVVPLTALPLVALGGVDGALRDRVPTSRAPRTIPSAD
jgi:hypothetical protein